MTIMFTLSIIIAVGCILIFIISTYNRFQDYIIRINEAEVSIDSV